MPGPLLQQVAAPPPTMPDLHLDLDPGALAADLDRVGGTSTGIRTASP